MQKIISKYKKFVTVILLTNFLLQSCGHTHTENEIRSIAISNETMKRFDQSLMNNGVLAREEFIAKQNISHREDLKEDIVLKKTKHIVKNKGKLKTKKIVKNQDDLVGAYRLLKLENEFFKNKESQISILTSVQNKKFKKCLKKPIKHIVVPSNGWDPVIMNPFLVMAENFLSVIDNEKFFDWIPAVAGNFLSRTQVILCTEKKDLIEMIFKPELNRIYKYRSNVEDIKEGNESENGHSKPSEQIQPIKNKNKYITSKNKKYEPAAIDRFSDKEACFLKTIARGNYPIEFFPQENNWMARVIDNLTPGFTRTMVLPVLYAIHHNEHPYTIEKIFNAAMKKNHRELINIVFPEKSLQKQGIVYIGEKMGLKGGGGEEEKKFDWPKFWKDVGYVIACIVIGAVIGCLVGGGAILLGIAFMSLGKSIMVGAILGGVIALSNLYHEYHKKKETEKIQKSIDVCRDAENKAISSAAKILDELKYENVLGELENLNGLIDSVDDSSNKSREISSNRTYKEENEDLISKSESESKKVLNDLEKKRKEIKDKAESLALAQLQKYRSELKRSIDEGNRKVVNMLNDITKPKSDQDHNKGGKSDKDYRKENIYEIDGMITSMDSRISVLESLAREPAIFHEKLDIGRKSNVDQVNAAIGLAKMEKHLLEVKKEFLQFGYKDGNNTRIVDEAMLNKDHGCFTAIDRGELSLLKYLIECEKVDVNSIVNVYGKSLLQNAIKKNKVEIVEYLRTKGAK